MPGSMQIRMKACGVTTSIAIEGSDTIDKIKEQIGNMCEIAPSNVQLTHMYRRLREGTADQAGIREGTADQADLSDILYVTFLGVGSKTSGYQRIRRVMRTGAALRSYKKVSDTNHTETRAAIKKHMDDTAESIVRRVVAAQVQAAASSTDSVALPVSVHVVGSGPASGEKSDGVGDGVGDGDSSSGDDESSESSSDDPNSGKAEGITGDKAEGITGDKAEGITIDKAEGITIDKASEADMSIVIASMNIDAALNLRLNISIRAPLGWEYINVKIGKEAIFEEFGELQVQTFEALESK